MEFSKGGDLQKQVRNSLDRITSMLGFKVRVTEKGGDSIRLTTVQKEPVEW